MDFVRDLRNKRYPTATFSTIGHETFAKRTKRSHSSTHAQPSISSTSVNKSAGGKSAPRWAEKNRNKFWLAKAILEENDTQYRIRYEPVYEGAQPEISWQPKRFANAAISKDWEERKMAVALGSCNADNDSDSMSKDDEAGQRSDFVSYGHQNLVANLPSQEPYNAHLKNREQHTIDTVDKRTLAGFGKSPEDTLLTAASISTSEVSTDHSEKSSPRSGTSISTILCEYNKGDQTTPFAEKNSSQASPRVSTEVKVPNDSDLSSGPPSL